MNKKKAMLLFAAVVAFVVAMVLFSPQTIEVDLTGDGVRYDVNDATVADVMPMTFQGKLRGARVGDSEFRGTIDIPALWAEFPEKIQTNIQLVEYVTVDIDTRTDIAGTNVVFHEQFGAISSYILHSVVMPKDGAYAIILPWGEYRAEGSSVTTGFSADDFTFICVGDITREEALTVLKGNDSIS